MSKLKLMILCLFHLGLEIKNKEQLMNLVAAIDLANELEPFKTGAEVETFVTNLLFLEEKPSVEQTKVLKVIGAKVAYYFFQIPPGK